MGEAYVQQREATDEEIESYKASQQLRRRRGIIPLSLEQLVGILNLPPDTDAVGMHYDWRTQQFELIIIHPSLPIVPDATEAPILQSYIRAEACEFAHEHFSILFPEATSE